MPLNSPSSAIEDVEVAELTDFLAALPPFDTLTSNLRSYAARHLEIEYQRTGTTVLNLDDPNEHLYIVRTGAVELHDANDSLVARLGEGEYFGYPSLLTESPARRQVTTIEDSLLYLLPAKVFNHLRAEDQTFDHFFNRAHAERIQAALRERRQNNATLTTTVGSLLTREPVWTTPDTSIRTAARQMREARVSSLLIYHDDLRGIVTDRDLRNRVVAADVDPDQPVSEVMTADPVTINTDAYAFEALLVMSRHNVHHLPVVKGDTLRGVITTTDLMRLQADNPVYLVGAVWKQDSVENLAAVSERLPQVVIQLVEADARADDITRVVTAVTDAITQRLFELATAKFGEPPVPYAWLALGSQARQEQTAHSDQDHALLLSNDVQPEHDEYFKHVATFVSDGLNECGYEYCPGEVMATTDRWRQPISKWRTYFDRWIHEPRPKALMHSSIFFDMRHLHGDESLTRRLRAEVLERCKNNSIFLASLTVNALKFEPPLGFFRQFVLEKHGEHADTLDLKNNGVVPAVDIARIHALANGIDAVNTRERLDALETTRGIAASDAANLRDAFEFISMVRLRHQAQQLRAGKEPNNFVSPDELSDFDRRHLKDAFKVVSRMQSALDQRYQTSFIS